MKRHQAREQAFFFLFERSFNDDSLDDLISSAMLARDIKVSNFAKNIFNGVNDHENEIDCLIDQNSISWNNNRISKVAISVLRLAIFEMLYEKDIPISVSINEAVEIAKTYGSIEDASFINGVLGAISKGIDKPQEKEKSVETCTQS